ncbi:MAG: sugar O-acetyltransferase [Bacilli bacterium]|nr:sugar O-acetyltransferase [Bacilli bacterium]
MTEKEKMLTGNMYNANYDQELINERLSAKDLCFEYNNIKPSDLEYRHEILKKLIGKTKDSFIVEQPFYCDYGYNIEFGENFYANHNLVILDPAKVKFGDNVFIAPNCGFYTAYHPIEFDLRNEGLEFAKPIIVGNNVWIGGNVVVLAGVTIGDNVVIGAGSIVTKDIPSNSVAVGSPCKVIRKLSDKKPSVRNI